MFKVADKQAIEHVEVPPIADIGPHSLDHLVGAPDERVRDVEAAQSLPIPMNAPAFFVR